MKKYFLYFICLTGLFILPPLLISDDDIPEDQTELILERDKKKSMSVTLDRLEAIWTFQANSVARALELSEENSAKLVDSYLLGRNTYRFALSSLVRNSRDNEVQTPLNQTREYLKAMQKENMLKTWKEFLDKKQSTFAVMTLGSFQKPWDYYGALIYGMDLPEEKANVAFDNILKFVVAYESLYITNQQKYGLNVDALPMDKVEEIKDELDVQLKEILDEDMFKFWTSQT